MVYYKLDKIDKIFISIIFILVTFFCFLNVLCYASESVEIIKKDGLGLRGNLLLSVDSNKGYYFETIPGYTYKITFNRPLQYRILELNDVPEVNYMIGSGNGKLISNTILDEYTFTAKKDMTYIFAYTNSDFTMSVETVTKGLNGSIIQLSNIIDLTFFSDILVKIMPFVGVVVLFSLGVWFIKHNIIEHSKGRDF